MAARPGQQALGPSAARCRPLGQSKQRSFEHTHTSQFRAEAHEGVGRSLPQKVPGRPLGLQPQLGRPGLVAMSLPEPRCLLQLFLIGTLARGAGLPRVIRGVSSRVWEPGAGRTRCPQTLRSGRGGSNAREGGGEWLWQGGLAPKWTVPPWTPHTTSPLPWPPALAWPHPGTPGTLALGQEWPW